METASALCNTTTSCTGTNACFLSQQSPQTPGGVTFVSSCLYQMNSSRNSLSHPKYGSYIWVITGIKNSVFSPFYTE